MPGGPAHKVRWQRVVEWLASPHWMVAFFLLAAAGALAAAYGVTDATQLMLPPLALLSVNLVAAIATRPAFRRDAPLLLFHVALLALVLLFALGRLTYLDASVALSSGTDFEGELVSDERGPLHRDRLGELRFSNEGFTENYPRRGRYVATYNRISWWDEQGESHLAEIGDDHPLLLAGYRIYSTRQRGFSPVFHWLGSDGEEDLGAVQLRDVRGGQYAPSNEWLLPDGQQAWAMLQLEEMPKPAPGARQVDLNAQQLPHVLVLRVGETRHELRPGDALQLAGGRLSYVRLDSWMSYRIIHDPTRAWLVATVLVAIGCLVLFYLRRFRGSRIKE